MAELVILLALLRIAEHAVSLRCLFKFGLCLLVSGIGIRMIFFGELSVCLFQGIVIRVFGNAQNLIVISLTLCHVVYLLHIYQNIFS